LGGQELLSFVLHWTICGWIFVWSDDRTDLEEKHVFMRLQ